MSSKPISMRIPSMRQDNGGVRGIKMRGCQGLLCQFNSVIVILVLPANENNLY